jgi:hypothetical protein
MFHIPACKHAQTKYRLTKEFNPNRDYPNYNAALVYQVHNVGNMRMYMTRTAPKTS